jgi:hypothetical protein
MLKTSRRNHTEMIYSPAEYSSSNRCIQASECFSGVSTLNLSFPTAESSESTWKSFSDLLQHSHDDFWSYPGGFDIYSFEHLDLLYEKDFQPPL